MWVQNFIYIIGLFNEKMHHLYFRKNNKFLSQTLGNITQVFENKKQLKLKYQ